MSKQKSYEIDSLLDKDLCSIMGDKATDETIKPRKNNEQFSEHQKRMAECRRYQIANAARRICFLAAMVIFLHWATGKGLIDPVISIPGFCLCTAISGYHLGCCRSNLQQLSVMILEGA